MWITATGGPISGMIHSDRFTQGSRIGTDPVRRHGTLIGTDWLPPREGVQEGGKVVMIYPAEGPGVNSIWLLGYSG